MNVKSVKNNIEDATVLLKAFSNEKRLIVLCALCDGEKSVGELESIVGLSQSALSQHLARLRRDRLVATRREAQTIYYALNGEETVAILKCLHHIFEE